MFVPADTDLDLTQEFSNIKHWAAENKMVINSHKTAVFHRKLQIFSAAILPNFINKSINI